MKNAPITLGDRLDLTKASGKRSGIWARRAMFILLNGLLILAIVGVGAWGYLAQVEIAANMVPAALAVLIVFWAILAWKRSASREHFLLANDQKGFMRDLRLDAKTAIIDGSNIYHLGRANGLDALPLGKIAQQLRNQGYRIVCFFDANIFFTLGEHGAFLPGKQHSPVMLETIFGLNEDEIYVVPSGVQADGYILESLSHLPVSFAVTNDRFRDYAKQYAEVMTDSLWRKGVEISNDEVQLLQHRF